MSYLGLPTQPFSRAPIPGRIDLYVAATVVRSDHDYVDPKVGAGGTLSNELESPVVPHASACSDLETRLRVNSATERPDRLRL